MKFLNFCLWWVIFALLGPNSEYESGSTDLIETGSNPEPIRIQSGSNPDPSVSSPDPSGYIRILSGSNPDPIGIQSGSNPNPDPKHSMVPGPAGPPLHPLRLSVREQIRPAAPRRVPRGAAEALQVPPVRRQV
jgi:hypothetical protein